MRARLSGAAGAPDASRGVRRGRLTPRVARAVSGRERPGCAGPPRVGALRNRGHRGNRGWGVLGQKRGCPGDASPVERRAVGGRGDGATIGGEPSADWPPPQAVAPGPPLSGPLRRQGRCHRRLRGGAGRRGRQVPPGAGARPRRVHALSRPPGLPGPPATAATTTSTLAQRSALSKGSRAAAAAQTGRPHSPRMACAAPPPARPCEIQVQPRSAPTLGAPARPALLLRRRRAERRRFRSLRCRTPRWPAPYPGLCGPRAPSVIAPDREAARPRIDPPLAHRYDPIR